MDHLLSLSEVKNATSLGKTTIYRLMRDSLFPQPVYLSARRVAWLGSDIQTWISARLKTTVKIVASSATRAGGIVR